MRDKYVFGIDIGGTSIKMGLFTTNGALTEKWEISTDIRNQGESILTSIAQSMMEHLKARKLSNDDVVGVGLGVPGAVRGESFVAPCVNLNQWGNFDAAQSLEKLCGLPVKVVNDANAAALGETWQGSAKGSLNIVFVTLGTGVGGGIVVDGKIISGTHGAGGEIGHIKVREGESRTCGCGKHGCLEQYASATGLANEAALVLAESNEPSILRNHVSPGAKEVFRCATDGDKLAVKLVDNFALQLGRALASVSCICDPETIVLGGGVSAAGEPLLNAVRKAFLKHAFPSAEGTKFRLAKLGNDAGIYGAARLLLI